MRWLRDRIEIAQEWNEGPPGGASGADNDQKKCLEKRFFL
jgi:hypothetical protein